MDSERSGRIYDSRFWIHADTRLPDFHPCKTAAPLTPYRAHHHGTGKMPTAKARERELDVRPFCHSPFS